MVACPNCGSRDVRAAWVHLAGNPVEIIATGVWCNKCSGFEEVA